jgi:hypothetical protein
MPDGGLFVYKCARDAHEQITRLSDFVSPTIVAMWNLRWQVQGFIGAMPRATQDDIVQRFALGSDVRGNEIKRACVENSWEDQQSRFSSILLTNTIAIFEEFLEGLVSATIASDEARRKAVKALQFPVAQRGKNYLGGYAALGLKIPELAGVFNSGKALGRWYSGAHVQNLLLCYRFFKEIRNVGVHNGGRATQELMNAYAGFLPVATPTNLGLKEVPKHAAPVLDQVILPELRGAYGFSDVVLRLIATYDRELSDRKGALAEIDRRMKVLPGVKRSHSIEPGKRTRLIDGLFLEANLPKGNLTPAFFEFLKRTKRIPAHW